MRPSPPRSIRSSRTDARTAACTAACTTVRTAPRAAARRAFARNRVVAAIAVAIAFAVSARHALGAQATAASSRDDILDAVASWIALDVTPGREALAAPQLEAIGFQRAPLDGFMVRRGKGSPRRVVACALDQAGYVVSAITDDGFLRLHYSGNARRTALWDQFHEGQRIRVRTARGTVPGVIAVRSTHLWRARTPEPTPASIENFYVDVGARSRAEAQGLGIALLDQVAREQTGWRYADMVAGPGAAARAGCAAVAAASRLTPARGETIYLLSSQSSFDFTGLSAALAAIGPVDSLVIADPVLARADSGEAGVQIARRTPNGDELPLSPKLGVGATSAVGVRTSFRGTLVESIAADDAAELFREVGRSAGVTGTPLPVSLPERAVAPPRTRTDSLATVDALLTTLTNSYGVSEHEAPVRNVVLQALPAWARARARVDSIGDIVLATGPARDTVLFIAHLDEIGFEVTRIAPDGTLSLRTRGGFFRSLWEGQPALLHFDAPRRAPESCALRFTGTDPRSATGVFVPRQAATAKQPMEVTAWMGVDSVALAACGVTAGMSLTGVKHATDLAGTRFSARSIDDRAGCAALILAVRALDERALGHAVLFVWSVQEETALGGAAWSAARLGPSVKRVHAVDTFVSSDSPLESDRFARAPIGAGPVVRALDNSSATPAADVDRVVAIAKAGRIPLQVGTTNGGNDGSELARFGAVDVPVGWPLRYSHSPAEVIDLRDVQALSRLVLALATSR
ncbi:MAG: M20/M25/M40 family metallo-hydrolase [Gemmatimonadaceae bacterium]